MGWLYVFTVANDDRKSITHDGYVIDSFRRVKTITVLDVTLFVAIPVVHFEVWCHPKG